MHLLLCLVAYAGCAALFYRVVMRAGYNNDPVDTWFVSAFWPLAVAILFIEEGWGWWR